MIKSEIVNALHDRATNTVDSLIDEHGRYAGKDRDQLIREFFAQYLIEDAITIVRAADNAGQVYGWYALHNHFNDVPYD